MCERIELIEDRLHALKTEGRKMDIFRIEHLIEFHIYNNNKNEKTFHIGQRFILLEKDFVVFIFFSRTRGGPGVGKTHALGLHE